MSEQKVVIIIEDEEDWLEILRGSIASLGYKIETYRSFSNAKGRLMGHSPYHLVITDIYEGSIEKVEKKGLKFAEYVSNVKDIPVILISGLPDEFIVRKAFKECRVVDFIFKGSFDDMEFARIVKSAVEKYSSTEMDQKQTNSKTYYVEKGGVLIIQDGSKQTIGNISLEINSLAQSDKKVEELIQLLSERFTNLMNDYDDKLKDDLNQIFGRVNEFSENRQALFSDIMTQMSKIAETNDLVKDYLSQLAESESSGNEDVLKSKFELSIALIPGILKLKTDLKLDSSLRKIGDKYNEVTFKAYEKLSNIYYSLRERLKI